MKFFLRYKRVWHGTHKECVMLFQIRVRLLGISLKVRLMFFLRHFSLYRVRHWALLAMLRMECITSAGRCSRTGRFDCDMRRRIGLRQSATGVGISLVWRVGFRRLTLSGNCAIAISPCRSAIDGTMRRNRWRICVAEMRLFKWNVWSVCGAKMKRICNARCGRSSCFRINRDALESNCGLKTRRVGGRSSWLAFGRAEMHKLLSCAGRR